ncbi:hypothetical protein HPP92_001981 [Vanilla planifolia]|uniref:Myb/SANT-like DNA-binding domain-containing protein n=1 Tax=Vanilla planifolia TaxID=51239 RepID=A0A835VHK2_VANPL|nr:hypothetical protein HPP92_001981 [Vanilla planifolia]
MLALFVLSAEHRNLRLHPHSMETQEPYFHLPPELRQFMLLGAKPPLYNTDGFCSTGPEAPISRLLPCRLLHPPATTPLHLPPETLTLLEIRSRLDPKFRESGQKAALWDEIARIMAEEYGYQRSGRKCRRSWTISANYKEDQRRQGREARRQTLQVFPATRGSLRRRRLPPSPFP